MLDRSVGPDGKVNILPKGSVNRGYGWDISMYELFCSCLSRPKKHSLAVWGMQVGRGKGGWWVVMVYLLLHYISTIHIPT